MRSIFISPRGWLDPDHSKKLTTCNIWQTQSSISFSLHTDKILSVITFHTPIQESWILTLKQVSSTLCWFESKWLALQDEHLSMIWAMNCSYHFTDQLTPWSMNSNMQIQTLLLDSQEWSYWFHSCGFWTYEWFGHQRFKLRQFGLSCMRQGNDRCQTRVKPLRFPCWTLLDQCLRGF